MKKLLTGIVTLGLVAVLVPYTLAKPDDVPKGPAPKVDVCHMTEGVNDYLLINVSENALNSHLTHGDYLPGDTYPGDDTKKFAEDCSIVDKEWVRIDTFFVPATTADPTISNEVLEDGVEYKVEAVGTYFFRTENSPQGYLADAEWALRDDAYGYGWTKGDEVPYSAPYNGLDLCFDVLTNTDWGSLDETTSTYSTMYVGTGSTLSMFIKDSGYTDNSGGLTVNVYELQ